MPNFYGTFRQADHARKNKFVVIKAANDEVAFFKMKDLFGRDWANLYDEKEFAGQVERYGLTELKLL